LLKQELATAPAMSTSAERAAHQLAFEFSEMLDPQENVYWKWLENRPRWEYNEQRLLWRILENTPEAQREKMFTQAEGFCKSADATRSQALGWMLNRMHYPVRSIPLLKDAMNRTTGDQAQSAAFTLMESYLDTGNWKEAEALFTSATTRLTSEEQPEWHSRIAVIAARSGNLQDAMRLWKKTANLDLSCMNALKDLAKSGLRDELKQFYREVQIQLPGSAYPKRALMLLMGNQ